MHIKNLLDNGMKKVNQLHKVISNRNVNLSACRLLLFLQLDLVLSMEVRCGKVIRVRQVLWNP